MAKIAKKDKEKLGELDWQKSSDGLIPAVVQNANTKDVLMLGYMNKEALDATLDKGLVTFYSRSKSTLWTKGETSGNVLHLTDLAVDCDNDTILIKAVPKGPTCHTGTTTCFGEKENGTSSIAFLLELSAIIKQRRKDKPKNSYIAKMFKKGRERIAKKVGEEGVEVALAHMSKKKKHTREEAADLMFHYLMLLEHADITLADVCGVLSERHSSAKKEEE